MSAPSPRQEIRARLDIAREAWKEAQRELIQAEEMQRNGGAENPDGVIALRNARLNLGLAGARFRACLEEFSTELLRNQ